MTTTHTTTGALDLDKLEALARAATPGHWFSFQTHACNGAPGGKDVCADDGTPLISGDRYPDDADADFMAAANPAAVLELIALARAGQQAGEAAGDLPPIEFDQSLQRTYIPLPGGWEIQTKGNGSTFRIAHVQSKYRWQVLDEKLHEPLEAMARDARNALRAMEQEIADLREQLASAQRNAEQNGLLRSDIKTMQFAAAILEGLGHEDTAGDLRDIAARAQLTNPTGDAS